MEVGSAWEPTPIAGSAQPVPTTMTPIETTTNPMRSSNVIGRCQYFAFY